MPPARNRRDTTEAAPDVAPGVAVDPEANPSEGSADVVQKLLLAKGYLFDHTGTMTGATVDAITHFQLEHGLEPTGVVGRGDDPTWKELNK